MAERKIYHDAIKKYKQKAIKKMTWEFNRNTEADLLEHLEQQPNKAGYVKGLIRADMERQKLL